MSKGRGSYDTHIGKAVNALLDARNMTTAKLAERLCVAPSMVSQFMIGWRKPSAKWVELVADAMGLDPADKQKLHIAAARDHGFKLDLTGP